VADTGSDQVKIVMSLGVSLKLKGDNGLAMQPAAANKSRGVAL